VATLQEILKDTAEYVAWKLEEGETTAEVSASILSELVPQKQETKSVAMPKQVSPEHKIAKTKTAMPATTPAQDPIPSSDSQPSATASDRDIALQNLANQIKACTACPLHSGRIQAVPGQGNSTPEIMFIGEAPGADEDEKGLAFVGRAGQLLTKMIEAMGYTRDEVFIANVNKCRPPNNRKPLREEMDTCLPYLRQQVAILQPKVIVALGATAVEGLVPESASEKISVLRGNWLSFEGIPLMPTYHPAYLLRSPTMKKPVWEDLQAVLHKLGRTVPKRA